MIGRMIRSAKMKLTTPPKLMPPFHSTAASGTLPIEQTKAATATSGPMSGPHTFDAERVVGEEQVLPEGVRDPRRGRAGDEQADRDVAQHRRPLHHEVVADRGEPVRAAQPLRGLNPRRRRTCPSPRGPPSSRRPRVRRARGASASSRGVSSRRKQHGEQHDHHRAADELGRGELPAEQQAEDQARVR